MAEDKNLTRIRRQFDALSRRIPPVRGITGDRMRWVRVPIALLLVAGGVVGFLPLVGFWMLPLGLLLLAIDIPFLRPRVAAGTIWARRRARLWMRRGRARETGGQEPLRRCSDRYDAPPRDEE